MGCFSEMSQHRDLGWWEKMFENYGDWIVLYFTVIFAIFGAFCFGVWLMA